MRHEEDLSRVAGDTSDASNTVHHLRSIHEGDGDAVKASSVGKTSRWFASPRGPGARVQNGSPRYGSPVPILKYFFAWS